MNKKVPFIDPARNYQLIKNELDQAYFDVMTRADLINRKDLDDFEKNYADFIGTKYAIGVNSGYHALMLSLKTAGVGKGDEVIVPAHTFVASCSAVVNVDGTPVLVDVGEDYNIDVDKIEEAVTEKTKAIMPVHLNGLMADMPGIMPIAEKYKLIVIEDAAQSVGASIDGRKAGSWGTTGCWSFFPFKILGGYGDGGAITTDDPDIALAAKRMRYNGEDRNTRDYYGHGYTCLLDNLQAAFLDVKLRHLPDWIIRRKFVANRYKNAFSNIEELILPHYDYPGFDHVYQNYVVRTKYGDEFSDYLKKNGVEVLTQWRKPYYKYDALALVDRGFPETEALSAEVCSLPMNVEMSDEDVDYIIKVVKSYFESK